MEIKRSILVLAFLITAFLFLTIIILGMFLDEKRKDSVDESFQSTYQDINDIQKFMLMSETYGNDMACIAYKSKLSDLDKKIWDLGIKLEQYRVATEEFSKNKYYVDQKKSFNENEVIYLMLLTNIKQVCGYDQAIISFFYQNSEDCKKCDDQSFVLTDINKMMDKDVSIFSFDVDLNVTTISLLKEYYKINEFPCIVINEEKFCGIQDKDFIVKKICEKSNLTACQET